MDAWGLPTSAVIGGKEYAIHADYREVLDLLAVLQDPQQAEWERWYIALALFYEGGEAIPADAHQEAMEYLVEFINCGQREEPGRPAPRLMDWQQDALAIVAGVNKAAGCEVRALLFLHWWSFMAFFNSMGEGQFATLVSIRDKLRRGKKLESWEREYYRDHRAEVDLTPRYTAEELAEQRRLKELLEG